MIIKRILKDRRKKTHYHVKAMMFYLFIELSIIIYEINASFLCTMTMINNDIPLSTLRQIKSIHTSLTSFTKKLLPIIRITTNITNNK